MIKLFQQDNRATKALFAVIIGAAILTMVITLVPGIFDNSQANDNTVYAKVRSPHWYDRVLGETIEIKTADVESIARRQLQAQHLPDMYLPLLLPRVGQQQVERAVLQREADKLGLQVSSADLKRELEKGPLSQYLFPDGKYIGDDKYINFVEQNFGVPIVEFENEVKSDMEIQRLQALVTGGVTVADSAVRTEYLNTGTKVKFDYAVINASDLKKTLNPSDDELQAFFKQNSARYATALPETRKIQFFAFDASNLPGGKPQIDDAAVQAYYNSHAKEYAVQEQVKTRHILIQVPKGADAKTDAAGKAKAEDVLKQLSAGGNFAELAKKYSDDPGSKTQGGELPLIPTSGLDPAYAKAAMALNPGQTSPLVRSSFGYHIIQTEQKVPAGTRPLAEVKPQIVAALESQKVGADEASFATKLVEEAKTKGLDAAAKAHNLQVQTTDYIAQGAAIPSLPDGAALVTSAFGAPKGGPPASATTGEGYAIYVVTDVKPAHAPAFADWKAHVLDDYREQKAPDLLNAQLNKLAALAQQEHDLKKAAATMNIPVKSSDLVGRDGSVPEVGAMSGPAGDLFALSTGGISKAINSGPNGFVAELTDKQQPSADDIAKNFMPTKDKLLNEQRSEVFNLFAGTLMDRYEKAGGVVYSRKQQQAMPFGG